MRYRLSGLLPDFIKRIGCVQKTSTPLFLSLFLSALCLGSVSSFASVSTSLDHPVSIDNKGKGQTASMPIVLRGHEAAKKSQIGQSYKVAQFRGKRGGNRSFRGNNRQRFQGRSAPRNNQVKSAPRNNQLRRAPRRQQVRSAPRNNQIKSGPRRQQVRRAPRRQQVRRAPRRQQAKSRPRRQQARARVATRRATSYRKAKRRSTKRRSARRGRYRIIRAQRRLKRLRFYRGRIDGIAGRKTRRAIVLYKRRFGSTKRLYR